LRYIGQLPSLPRSLSAINDFLTSKEVGGDYGVGFKEKLALLYRFNRSFRRINTLSDLREHVELAAAILRTPKETPGCVVEAGCFMGGSTANLSLVCALTGRKLIVFDSFQGLPEPKEYDRWRHSVGDGHTDVYYKGRFAAAQKIVEQNVTRFGRIDVCEFRAGLYDETMPGFSEPVVMAYFDGDLVDSLKPCLAGLWPNLAPGGRLYTHEARNLSFIAIYFDQAWWRENLGEDAPGFVGSGVGLPLGVSTRWGSDIGYAQKPGQAPEVDPTRDPAVLQRALFDWERADYAERLKD
jgi:O-methyltransferase